MQKLPGMQEMQIRSVRQEYPLEEDMTTHSSILAWEIPWTEEPGGYRPWSHREHTAHIISIFIHARKYGKVKTGA